MKKTGTLLLALCSLAMLATTAFAQNMEVKEKPRLYTYVAFWAVPRASWADMKKLTADEKAMMDKDVASGDLLSYGDDVNLLHTDGGFTHDSWFQSNSMAGLLNTLDAIYKSPIVTSSAQQSATHHSDLFLVSRYYNWHPVTIKDGYSVNALYKFKSTAPDDALDTLCKNLIVPIIEKALADGSIAEYEIDTEAMHSDAPGLFYISYIAAKSEGIDKVSTAIRDAVKATPLSGSSFAAMTEASEHRDFILRTNASYK